MSYSTNNKTLVYDIQMMSLKEGLCAAEALLHGRGTALCGAGKASDAVCRAALSCFRGEKAPKTSSSPQ
jgi:hypothetical protein